MKVTVYIDKYACDRNGCSAVLAGTVANPRPDFRKFGWSTIEGLCDCFDPCPPNQNHTLHFCSERCKQNARGKWTKMPPPEPLMQKLNDQTETIQKLHHAIRCWEAREKELELRIKKLEERIARAHAVLLPLL